MNNFLDVCYREKWKIIDEIHSLWIKMHNDGSKNESLWTNFTHKWGIMLWWMNFMHYQWKVILHAWSSSMTDKLGYMNKFNSWWMNCGCSWMNFTHKWWTKPHKCSIVWNILFVGVNNVSMTHMKFLGVRLHSLVNSNLEHMAM